MARILFINSVCYGSTGSICKNLYRMAESKGHECCIAYGRGEAAEGFTCKRIGNNLDVYTHGILARINDMSGFGSVNATKSFVHWLEEYKPDIIHMHNLHGYYLNIEVLFQYLKNHPEIKKIWTLHDCWSFTGHCPHFQYEKCHQWIEGCKKCPRTNEYPKSLLDKCGRNYEKKKRTFLNVNNMTIVTPSEWLRQLAEKSYLKGYKTVVVYNGINTDVFKPTESSILEKYHIGDKKVILGVASVWDHKKGLDSFVKLSSNICDDYKIVLIGLSEEQVKQIPPKIIGIERTENVNELVQWYSASTVFLNPSLEDTYPTVNLEAQACGTYVLTFDTGGMKETIKYSNGRIVNSIDEALCFLEKNDIPKVDNSDKIQYDLKDCFKEYIKMYDED